MPKSRTEFWAQKLGRNAERDRQTIERLEHDGWRVEVIWECETRNPNLLRERIVEIFSLRDVPITRGMTGR